MSSDYAHVLREAFHDRRAKNPAYSLRAFARDLRVPASNLSLILKGKKGMNAATARKVADCLGMNSTERTRFVRLVEKAHARSPAIRKRAAEEIARTEPWQTNLSSDMTEVVSDWRAFAILEYLRLPTATQSPAAIAKALELPKASVADMLATLLRLELLERKDGKLTVVQDYHWSVDGVPSTSVRKGHERFLEKAKTALHTQPIEERDFSCINFPLDSTALPAAKRELRAFLRKFNAKYADSAKGDRVYSLCLQFFNLTPGLSSPSPKESV